MVRPDPRWTSMHRLIATLAVVTILVAGCAFGPAASQPPPAVSGSPSSDSGAVVSPVSSPTATATESATPSTPTVSPPTSASPVVSPSSSSNAAPSSSTPTRTPAPTPTPTAARTPAPTPTPARTPAPIPIPTPTRTPAPTPTLDTGPSFYVTNGSRTSNKVALTFDFGGRVGDALPIVRYLVAQGIHATIFSTGNQADLAATDATVHAVYDTVCATSDHLTLGNHSMTHADFATLTPDQMRWQLASAQAALAGVCPAESPLPFFRPPSGSLGGWHTAKFYEILDAVGSVGYSRTVTWDVDTLDWGAPGTKYYRTTDQIVANVEANAKGGSIVLMHLGGYNTYAAIQVLVPWLRAHGYQLVDLHEMLGV